MPVMDAFVGLLIAVGSCFLIATAATLWMVGMARLESAMVRVEPARPMPYGSRRY